MYSHFRSLYVTTADLMRDLKTFMKGIVDNYTAILFSQRFIEKCLYRTLYLGRLNKTKNNLDDLIKLKVEHNSIGFVVGIPIPTEA